MRLQACTGRPSELETTEQAQSPVVCSIATGISSVKRSVTLWLKLKSSSTWHTGLVPNSGLVPDSGHLHERTVVPVDKATVTGFSTDVWDSWFCCLFAKDYALDSWFFCASAKDMSWIVDCFRVFRKRCFVYWIPLVTATTLLLLLILLLSDSSHIGVDARSILFLFCERYMFRIVDSFCVCKKYVLDSRLLLCFAKHVCFGYLILIVFC